jgi:glycerol-3-phosphate acyltransferase PlsX
MESRIVIALDAMGGDIGPAVVVPAAFYFVKDNPSVDLILVGKQDAIEKFVPDTGLPEQISIHPASQEVGMDELPSHALRNKKDSSMRVAIDLVKQGKAKACVSAGNTGALMATSRFVLKMLPKVKRPAIITALPSIGGRTWMLDLGANVDCTAEHLFQFAVMGAELVTAVDQIERPKIGLLNIGQEEIKGIQQVKDANELMNQADLNYIGYVEGDDIFLNQEVDIIVTDGFVGNVAIKTSEGLAKMIRTLLKKAFGKNLLSKLAALVALPVLKNLSKRIDPKRYNGASLLGLKGIVIKSHGGAEAKAFSNAITIACKEVRHDIAAKIEAGVTKQLQIQVTEQK